MQTTKSVASAIILCLAPVLALAATPLAAQQHQHGAGPPDMAAMHCGAGMAEMMRGMHTGPPRTMPAQAAAMHQMMMNMMGPPAPAMLLHHKDQLALTAAQIARLEALQKEAEPACRQHMQLGMAAHIETNQLLSAPAPDYAAYETKLKEAMSHMAEAHVAMAKAVVAARETLTSQQRDTLKNMLQQMHKPR